MMKYELEDFHRDIPLADLVADLKRAHALAAKDGMTLSYRSYGDYGQYSAATIAARFGSWNQGLANAGLAHNEVKDASEEELFLNLERVWIALGRQPKTRDLKRPLSTVTHDVYSRRFGSFRQALQAFLAWVQERDPDAIAESTGDDGSSGEPAAPSRAKRRTSRNISDRMRFRVLMHDGFACQSCGASPQKQRGVELRVDHIVPWSKGGETVEENLQTKCQKCNLGKGNAFNV